MNVERNSEDNIPLEERQEIDPTASARWFAGALEPGGTLAFGIQRRKTGHVAAYPFIEFRESNEQFIDLMQAEYEGSRMRIGNSLSWRLNGYKAAEIAADLEPYAVSRREMVVAVQNWLQADTPERVEIAESMKGRDRLQDVSKEDYGRIVGDAIFMAGVIDNKGTIYPNSDGEHTTARIEVRSRNRPLLDAIQERFGGSITIVTEAGTPVGIMPNYVTKRDSYAWSAASAEARQLIGFTQRNLKISPYADWDRLDIEGIRQARQEEEKEVIQYVQEEIERFKRGEIGRILTTQELADKFGLSHKTAKRRVSGLVTEIRKEREQILRGANRQSLTEAEITSAIESIVQEVQGFLDGRVERLSTNAEWEEKLTIGKERYAESPYAKST